MFKNSITKLFNIIILKGGTRVYCNKCTADNKWQIEQPLNRINYYLLEISL